MAVEAEVKLVVLYEEEIRKAAKLLDQAFNKPDDTPDEESSRMWLAALQACRVALYHPSLLQDTSIVMLTSGNPFNKRAKRNGAKP